jgi:hypothetical protein
MTTKFSFFTKLFDENEKAKNLYKDYDFSNMSEDKIYLLEKLSIISKYKEQFKNFLLKRKITDREKIDYILLYKPALTYPEYINFNNMVEGDEVSFLNSIYITGVFNFCAFVYLVIKKEPHQSIMKEMSLAFLMSLGLGSGYHYYNKRTYYKKTLSELYSNLEQRMNEFPDLKRSSQNKNYLTEENYEESMEDNF